jgi:uroporphyrinogen decarboxylase
MPKGPWPASDDREWIRKTIAHQETARVPYNFSFTPPVRAALEKHYGTGSLADTLGLPFRRAALKSVKPLFSAPGAGGGIVRDEFGIGWSASESDRGAPILPCLAEPTLSGYRFPDPAAPYRFENIGAWSDANASHYTFIWIGDLWERVIFMRGIENALLDMALNPAFLEELLRRLTEYVLETMRVLFASFRFDAVSLSDDYGTQRSMMMSPSAWRRFLKPRLAEIYDFAKKHNRAVLHHSCGNIYPIIGDMVDIGLEILDPIQPEAMDIFKLKREFGRRLTLCGGIRTQDLLLGGSARDVRDEIRRLKEEMGRGGGYILQPGNQVQPDVPLRNVVAMIEEARRLA